MPEPVLEQPVFVIGMPRSGTTILFEALARHPQLGWLSNYSRSFPRAPWVNVFRWLLDNRLVRLHGHKKQYGAAPRYNVCLPQPDEAYEFWDAHSGLSFSRDALHQQRCEPAARGALRAAVASVVGWQHRQRFAAKLTGPPRIAFLHSAFPDAYFVHVIRDGRAVTHSLLNVPFWRAKGGLARPFWSGLLEPADLSLWEGSARDAGVLAAVQWRRVLELAQIEAAAIEPAHYLEVRYEDFTAAPHATLDGVLRAVALAPATGIHRSLDAGPPLQNMNGKFRAGLAPATLNRVTAAMQPMLERIGYL